MAEEKINVATSWEAAMIDDFQEGVATPEEVIETTDQVSDQVNDQANDQVVEETIAPTEEQVDSVVEIVIPETPETVEEVIAERVVETPKVVLPDLNDDAKRIYEALAQGKEDEVLKYLSEKNKDYSTMSDLDVIKENIIKSNPTWNDKDVEAEIKLKYGSNLQKKNLEDIDPELEPEAYERAVEFNERVELRELLLSRDAREARAKLEETKKNIEFPKITEDTILNEPTPEQIAEANRQWESLVLEEMPKLSDFKYKLNGEEVVYKITNEEKASLTETMKSFNVSEYLTKRGWFDQDGNPNVLRISEDVYRLSNEGKMIGSVATQIKTATRKEVISKDIKNIDYDDKSSSNVKVQKPFWQIALEAGE